VATLPPGEDPDTLVRKGGIEALDAVLRDAIDVLERKIQLLERKGFFEGVEHRRDALDRLLPTLRAATDPITRELYLSLVSERAGVSKDVLERELREGVAAGQRGSGAEGRSEPSRRTTPGPRGRRNPETQLLTAMFAAPELITRAREDVSPTLVEKPQLREVFECLLRSDSAASQMPDGLSEHGAAAWSYLKEAAEKLSGQEVVTVYDRAAQILQARSQYRAMTTIMDPGEKQRKRAELRALFPAADDWYEYHKAAARGARPVNPSRGA
jgi:DNA primase